MNCRNTSPRGRTRWWGKQVVLFASVLLLGVSAIAQVTIPAANTNTGSNRKPLGSFFGFERNASIYLQSEIGTTGNVTAVAWFVNSVSSPAASTPIQIYIKETTAATFAATTTVATELSGATLVYSGNVLSSQLVANAWTTITLTTPFNYTGGANNLEVIVLTNATGGGNEGSGTAKQFRYSNAGAARSQSWQQDTSAPTGNGSLTTIATNGRPNIQLTIAPATPCSGTPNAGTAAPSSASVCSGFTTTFSATGLSSGTGLTFQWEESDDNGGTDPWANAVGGSGATSSSYTTPALSSVRYYRLRSTCSNTAPPNDVNYSNSVVANIVNCTYDVTLGSASFTSIMPANGGTGTAFPGWQSLTSGDDNTSTTVSLAGTTFVYQGAPVTGFQACSNGWMTFNTSNTSVQWTNDLTAAAQTRLLAPFWDDLVFTGQAYANRDASLRYQVSGTLGSGSAVITVEWAGMERFNIAGPNMNFQVKLYEAGNIIEYIYGNFEGFDGTVTTAYSYSIGYNGTNPPGTTAADRFMMQTQVTNHWGTTNQTGHIVMPSCNTKFTLTPGVYTGPGSAPTIPAPDNDDSGSPTALTVNGSPCTTYCSTYYTSRSATDSGMGQSGCTTTAGFEDDDVWFTFDANGSSNYLLRLRSSPNYDGVLQVFDVDGATNIACTNATGGGLIENYTTSGLTAGTYYVRVFHNGTGIGTSSGQFSLCVSEVIPPPANDNICGAISLTTNLTCTNTAGNTLAATASPQATCAGTADDDIWYSFTPLTSADLITVQSLASFNAHLQVFSSSDNTCTGTLTSLTCTNATSTGGAETYSGPWNTSNTYFIRVYHTLGGASTGQFNICITATAPSCPTLTAPADLATVGSDPTNLTWNAAAGATSYDVYFGTTPTPPFVGNQVGLSYSATPLAANTTYYWQVNGVNGVGTSTGCAVRSFVTQAPACVASPTAPTNGGSACEGPATTLSWPAVVGATAYDVYFDAGMSASTLVSPDQAGTTYGAGVLAAGSYAWRIEPKNAFGAAVGCTDFTFTVTPAPAGASLATAIPLTLDALGNASFNGNNLSSNCFSNVLGNTANDVFFSFTTSACAVAADAEVGTCTSSFDTFVRIFDATGATPLATDDDDCNAPNAAGSLVLGTEFSLAPSTTYIIVVEGFSTNSGTFTLSVYDGTPDTDGDLLNDCVDPCPLLANQVPGDFCEFQATNPYIAGILDGSCVCQQLSFGNNCTEQVVLELRTDVNSQQAGWEILDAEGFPVCQGGTEDVAYPNNITTAITENCCLPAGCYRLRVLDSGGDGFVTGGYQLRESGVNGRRIIDNMPKDGNNNAVGNFSTGSLSAIASTYENGAFCVPIGNDRPIFASCDKQDWVNNQFIVATENAAVTTEFGVTNTTSGYEFWFFDPNGSYSYRRFRNHATSDGFGSGATRACHFKINGWINNLLNPHIPANTLMNVRIRGRVAGNNLPFGPACLFKIDATRAACPIVKLQDNPLNVTDYSCGVNKTFGGGASSSNRITANPPQFQPPPLAGGTALRYQFRFRIPGEIPQPGSCIVRPAQTSATLNMNWTTGDKLKCNTTYEVDVRVSKDGGATWCVDVPNPACSGVGYTPWGKICTVNIGASTFCPGPLQGGSSSMSVENTGNLTMYPNPNRGDLLFVSLTSVDSKVNTVTVDIFDMTGKRVMARTIAAQDGMVNTNVDLAGELAGGLYMVNITAGDKTYTERLVIQP